MKKIFLVLLCSFFSLGVCLMQSYAVNVERLTPESADYEELTAHCTERVVDGVNDLSEFPDSTADGSLNASDIDWTMAYKVYVDESDIFSGTTHQTMQTLTDAMEYVWVLPVRVGKTAVNVTLSIGQTPDESIKKDIIESCGEETWEQMKADAGHWNPVEYEVSETTAETYEKVLDAVELGDQERVLLVGGTPRMRSAFAIAENADKQLSVVSMTPEKESAKLHTADIIDREESGELIGQKVYSFEEAARILAAVPTASGVGAGSGGVSPMRELIQWLGMASLVVLACAAFGYWVTRRPNK